MVKITIAPPPEGQGLGNGSLEDVCGAFFFYIIEVCLDIYGGGDEWLTIFRHLDSFKRCYDARAILPG